MSRASEELFTVKDVAEKLQVSQSAVRRLIAEGRLCAVSIRPGKFARHVRIRSTDLDAWIKSLARYAGCPSQQPQEDES